MRRIVLQFLPFLLLFLSLDSASSLRVAGKYNRDLEDSAIELNSTNFEAVLRETPASHAIVEFFAHWCPACRNYKPQYEKVARLFNGAEAVHPGRIVMARVDCALKINMKLCDRFSINHYPILLWGAPTTFISGSFDPKEKKDDIVLIDDARTSEHLLKWINNQISTLYSFDDEKFENEHILLNTSNPMEIARAIYDVEEAIATAFGIIVEHKMIKRETRASLIKFLQLLVVHHPSRRCRKGSADVLVNFDDMYPFNLSSSNNHEYSQTTFPICGKEVPRGYWMFCRGSKNDTRGFSCGLWVLLHSLSARIEDGESQFMFTTTCDFIHNFFICEECRRHFHEMCSRVTTPFNKSRDFVLWLWASHNEVNKRLMKEEASSGTGDPEYPKMTWPPKVLCASCYASKSAGSDKVRWNDDEVFRFLSEHYGRMLVSRSKGNDVNSVDGEVEEYANATTVPVGAALGIAAASCAFGALAYFWRMRQKNRKYFHQLHSLKTI